MTGIWNRPYLSHMLLPLFLCHSFVGELHKNIVLQSFHLQDFMV